MTKGITIKQETKSVEGDYTFVLQMDTLDFDTKVTDRYFGY